MYLSERKYPGSIRKTFKTAFLKFFKTGYIVIFWSWTTLITLISLFLSVDILWMARRWSQVTLLVPWDISVSLATVEGHIKTYMKSSVYVQLFYNVYLRERRVNFYTIYKKEILKGLCTNEFIMIIIIQIDVVEISNLSLHHEKPWSFLRHNLAYIYSIYMIGNITDQSW